MRGTTEDNAFDALCRRAAALLESVAETVGAERAAALTIDERSRKVQLLAGLGLDASVARRLHFLLRRSPRATAYVQLLDEVRDPSLFTEAKVAAGLPAGWSARLGFGAHLAVPLRTDDGSLVGCFALETKTFDARLGRIVEVAAALAAASIRDERISRQRAEEDARGEVLLEIVRKMNRRVSLPELLEVICRNTVQAFGVRQATIFYHHARAHGYVPLADFGTPPSVFERFVRSRYALNVGSQPEKNAGGFAQGRVRMTPHFDEITAGRTVVISRDNDLAPEDIALLDMTELRVLAMLPLRTNDQTRGTLCVGVAGEEELTTEQIRGLEIVAHHAATAIYQARSLRATEKAARFNAAVSALAVELNAEVDRERALALLCGRSRRIFEASSSALLLATEERLVGVAADGDETVDADAFSVATDCAAHPAVRALSQAEVVVANELTEESAPGFASRFRSLLAIPLIGAGGPIGVLLIGDSRHPRHFDPRMAEEAPVLGALAVTALRLLELIRELHETNSELRRVSGLKDQFLAHVSHDLRTPLSVIIGYGQLAIEGAFGKPGDELTQILARIVSSAQQQLALVGDLLDLSRIELNGLALKLSTVPLAPLFAELRFALASMVGERPVQAVVAAVEASLAVRADHDRLRQILTNLVGNAAKFTEAGSIEVEARKHGDRVVIVVRDTGSGIAPEDQTRIFEPFQQVDGARAGLGAGLGLAIARRLSVLMRGTLTVESAVGAGSTFRLTLPGAEIEVAVNIDDRARQ